MNKTSWSNYRSHDRSAIREFSRIGSLARCTQSDIMQAKNILGFHQNEGVYAKVYLAQIVVISFRRTIDRLEFDNPVERRRRAHV